MNTKPYFFIHYNKRLIKIKFDDINYVKANDDYCNINTTKDIYVIKITLKTLEEILPSETFFRCHRSFIVNIDKIEEMETSSNGYTTTINNEIIKIHTDKIQELFKKINMLYERFNENEEK